MSSTSDQAQSRRARDQARRGTSLVWTWCGAQCSESTWVSDEFGHADTIGTPAPAGRCGSRTIVTVAGSEGRQCWG